MTRAVIPFEDAPKPSYGRLALGSGYNAGMLVVLAAAAVFSGEWWLLGLACGLEVLWLTLAPKVPVLRAGFDKSFEAEQRRRDVEMIDEHMSQMSEEDRARVLELRHIRRMIVDAWRSNDVLRHLATAGEGFGDAERLERLTHHFVKVAVQAARYERYAEATDLATLEGDVKRQRAILDKTDASGPEAEMLAKKNLLLLERRLEKATVVRQRLRVARAQLQLIENTIRLFHDQVMTLESPEAFAEQLDELVSSIDVIELSGKDVDTLMQQLDDSR